MPNACLYARFSSEKQSETSVADQTRLCRSKAEALGFTVVATHADQAISGSTPIAARPGGRALLADVLARRFDVLLIEGLDRLSRDQVECEQTIRRLEHRGIRVIGVGDGYDSTASGRKMHRAIKSLMNEVYLDDLRDKTHRGLAGQVERGFHAGGRSFGYRSVAVDGGHHLAIDETEAAIVREIFAGYAAGRSPQRLAADLNARRVPAPRGGTWATSAIYGRQAKGSGILANPLYVGRYVWNRGQWVKDPDTGKRQRIARPVAEWSVIDRPELRIVDEPLWDAVQARLAKPRDGASNMGRPARTLFGGLLRCGLCGGAVVAVDAYRYGCAARKDRGACVCAGVSIQRETLDQRLLAQLRDDLLSPAAIARVQARARSLQQSPRDTGAARVAQLDGEIRRLTDAVAEMGLSDALKVRLASAENERNRLKSLAGEAQRSDAVSAHYLPAFRRLMADLSGSIERDAPRARDGLRRVFGEIQLEPQGDELYAVFTLSIDRILLTANASMSGCGGPLPDLEARRVRLR